MSFFDNKVVLITGGTGSFGKKFTELLLKQHNPTKVCIYSRGELLQVEMARQFTDPRMRFFIGDVRDKERLSRAMNEVDIVIHAAALKHVPICEYNPLEAVKTNIEGSANVVDCSIDNGVERVLAISTDKAVQPVNLYGATKLVAEKLFVQGNAYSGRRKTRFSCARYGNVIGSRGSVIPLFNEQKKKGEITITDERMTRFWITLAQGAEFVMKCTEIMKGGEVFVPKLPTTKITDLASAIAPGAKHKVVGIRAGEKLHEVLLTVDEARHAFDAGTHYVIEPEHDFWESEAHAGAKKLPEGFHYASDSRDCMLSQEQIKNLLIKEKWL